MNMIRVTAYCRVSTNSKDQINSLENQKSYFQREIDNNKDYEFVGIYADKGISGTKLTRPEFDKMLFDAGLDIIEVKNNDKDNRKEKIKYVTIPSTTRQPKFDRILVKNTSRFARNVLVEDILRDLSQNKVYVHFLDLNKCTENTDDITYIQIFQTFDERESRDKSKKVLFGIEESTKRGIINPGHNLYGYNYNKIENSLTINQAEAEVIKLIYNLYSKGYGLRRIRNVLNEKKIKTRNNQEFCNSTIRRIITNEKYIGVSIRRKYDTGLVFNKTSYPKVRPKEEWLTDGCKSPKIPCIITDELFYKCQEILHNSISHKNQKGLYKGTTEYAGLIYCGLCGSKYISNSDRGRTFYNCKIKKTRGLSGCNNNNISVNLLHQAISEENYKKTLQSYKEYFSMPLTYIRFNLEKKLKEQVNVTLLKRYKEEILTLQENNIKLIDLYTDGIITKDELIKKRKPNEVAIIELEAKTNEIIKPKEEIENDLLEVCDRLNQINNLEIKESYTKKEIFDDIERITIGLNKEIQVTYKTRYTVEKLLAKYNFKEVSSINDLANISIFENLLAWQTLVNSNEKIMHGNVTQQDND